MARSLSARLPRVLLTSLVLAIVTFSIAQAQAQNGDRPPATQSAPIPGSATVPSRSRVMFSRRLDPGPPGLPNPAGLSAGLLVTNVSDQPAEVSFGDRILTIAVPEGFTVVMLEVQQVQVQLPDCQSRESEPNVLTCTGVPDLPIHAISFTAADQTRQGVEHVSYPPGWNLIGGPPGTMLTGIEGPLYSIGVYFGGPSGFTTQYQPASSDTISALGAGYWVYVGAETDVGLRTDTEPTTPVALRPEGLALIGNPFSTPASVSGATAVYTYDPTTGSYEQTTVLQPGQGALAYAPGIGYGADYVVLAPIEP